MFVIYNSFRFLSPCECPVHGTPFLWNYLYSSACKFVRSLFRLEANSSEIEFVFDLPWFPLRNSEISEIRDCGQRYRANFFRRLSIFWTSNIGIFDEPRLLRSETRVVPCPRISCVTMDIRGCIPYWYYLISVAHFVAHSVAQLLFCGSCVSLWATHLIPFFRKRWTLDLRTSFLLTIETLRLLFSKSPYSK